MAASDWTCTANAAGSWLGVGSIWSVILDRTTLYNKVTNVPTDGAKLRML